MVMGLTPPGRPPQLRRGALAPNPTTAQGCAFTDVPVVAGNTAIKAVHVNELRVHIDALRQRYGLGGFGWNESLAVGTQIRAQHINELRTALAPAYTAATGMPPTYSTDPDPTLGIGTPVKAAHINELRGVVAAVE